MYCTSNDIVIWLEFYTQQCASVGYFRVLFVLYKNKTVAKVSACAGNITKQINL